MSLSTNYVMLKSLKRADNLIWRLLLVAAATPAGGSFTGAGTGTVGLEGGPKTSADTCWGDCMGGCSESFTASSAVGVDATVIFESPTSTSGVSVAGGGWYVFRCLRFLRKTLPSSVRTAYDRTSTWSSTWAFFHFRAWGQGSVTTASPFRKGDNSRVPLL